VYSGFTFSHYDLPFPTRYCIPYVRSGLYQLHSCARRIGGLAVMTLPGASRSFNPALTTVLYVALSTAFNIKHINSEILNRHNFAQKL